MGQTLSALKKTRDAKEDAQCPDAADGGFRRIVSPKVECVVSSAKGLENNQSSFVETFSETRSTNREPEAETVPMTLLTLSTELLLDVAHYLPPSSYMSLSYTCRTIRIKMGVSIAHVLGDNPPISQSSGSTPSVEIRNIRFLERMELRCMLGRDRKTFSSTAFCSGCQETHDCSLFSTHSLAQLGTTRRCLGSDGLLWVCPHRAFDYDEATRGEVAHDFHQCGSNYLFTHGRYGSTFYSKWPIMRVSANTAPSGEEVKEALRALDAPMCPHMRLNDAKVAAVYHPDCQKLRSNWPRGELAPDPYSSGPDFTVICNFCGIHVFFCIVPHRYGPDALSLLTRRSVECMWGCADRAWIAHVTQPADLEEYERAWEATNAECWRRFGSVGRDD